MAFSAQCNTCQIVMISEWNFWSIGNRERGGTFEEKQVKTKTRIWCKRMQKTYLPLAILVAFAIKFL
jgi:hypothetical protein